MRGSRRELVEEPAILDVCAFTEIKPLVSCPRTRNTDECTSRVRKLPAMLWLSAAAMGRTLDQAVRETCDKFRKRPRMPKGGPCRCPHAGRTAPHGAR